MQERKSLEGVIVRFERLNSNGGVAEVLAEKTFPDVKFKWYTDEDDRRVYNYICLDDKVRKYVDYQHILLDRKYDYADWENAPAVMQAFYNKKKENMYYVDDTSYEPKFTVDDYEDVE